VQPGRVKDHHAVGSCGHQPRETEVPERAGHDLPDRPDRIRQFLLGHPRHQTGLRTLLRTTLELAEIDGRGKIYLDKVLPEGVERPEADRPGGRGGDRGPRDRGDRGERGYGDRGPGRSDRGPSSGGEGGSGGEGERRRRTRDR